MNEETGIFIIQIGDYRGEFPLTEEAMELVRPYLSEKSLDYLQKKIDSSGEEVGT